jgi:hypothetical protein
MITPVNYHLRLKCLYNCQEPRDSSASSRISKGQGYQGFLRKRAGSSIWPKNPPGRNPTVKISYGKNPPRKKSFDEGAMN